MRVLILAPLLCFLLPSCLLAFAPITRIEQRAVSGINTKSTTESAFKVTEQQRMWQRQRYSVANIQTMGLFGLGGLEIAIILVGVGVVLGPERILEMVRSSGDTADEYKKELSKVPDEFKKGMEEGEMEARSRKAKVMKKVSNTDDDVK